MNARDRVLARVRAALADVPERAPEDVTRAYDMARDIGDPVDVLSDRLVDYRAIVHEVGADGLGTAIAAALNRREARRVVVPPGAPEEWRDAVAAGGAEAVGDEPPLAARDLDALDGVVTGCAAAIALTGTIVLDAGPGQGRRMLSLVPDYHLCVVTAREIVATVPEAIERLDPARPLTWISGPSATSDIELNRVEGVHGPRTLEVLIVRA
ncbi:MAG TPA: LUD domain-containing protein [Streptosporangiaceae bacterium]